ncbi:MAG: NUDIX domain-containing protein [Bacteroidota bacterium]
MKGAGCSGQWLSEEFVLSAGAVLFNQSLNKICIIQNGKGACFLPKGRKNVGECLAQTAVREVYEETGFRCRLLGVNMPSRATLVDDSSRGISDGVRVLQGATEPVAVCMRPGGDNNQKVIFWFVAVLDEGYDGAMRVVDGGFEADFYTFEEGLARLTFEDDIRVVEFAISIVRGR